MRVKLQMKNTEIEFVETTRSSPRCDSEKKYYSIRTEQSYVNWMKQRILFQRKCHQNICEKACKISHYTEYFMG